MFVPLKITTDYEIFKDVETSWDNKTDIYNIDKENMNKIMTNVFGKDINEKLVYIKLKIKGEEHGKSYVT